MPSTSQLMLPFGSKLQPLLRSPEHLLHQLLLQLLVEAKQGHDRQLQNLPKLSAPCSVHLHPTSCTLRHAPESTISIERTMQSP
jgi:hypothetical protein